VLSEAAKTWLAEGERGVSSETIFSEMTGIPVVGRHGGHPPCDPSDFRRCHLLLEAVPEFKARLAEMAGVSQVWARLVEKWDEIVASLDAEVPEWRSGRSRGAATGTYRMMKSLGC